MICATRGSYLVWRRPPPPWPLEAMAYGLGSQVPDQLMVDFRRNKSTPHQYRQVMRETGADGNKIVMGRAELESMTRTKTNSP
jgi:hypothetical protein